MLKGRDAVKEALGTYNMWENLADKSGSVWVFGYGSLTWKPGISYTSIYYGYIKGFKRRFWQGNTTHRGTPEQPGRVATLVPDSSNMLWGVAYELKGQEQIREGMASLTTREMKMGGYTTYILDFYRRETSEDPIPTIVYTATPENDLYLGPHHSLEQMALQIVTSHGQAGPNSDYVTKLAEFTRKYIPEETDEHLFHLDKTIRTLLAKRNNVRFPVHNKNRTRKLSGKQHNAKDLVSKSQTVSIVEPMCLVKKISYNAESENCDSKLLEVRVDDERDE